jgi:hypothetical protein
LTPLDESLKGFIKTSVSVFPQTTFGTSIRGVVFLDLGIIVIVLVSGTMGRRNGRRKLASSQ